MRSYSRSGRTTTENNCKRILGVDFGDRKIGVAVSDPLQILATPYILIDRKIEPDFYRSIQDLVKKLSICKIVVGLPLNMKGVDTPQTKKVRHFIEHLGIATNIEIIPVDERLSSKTAKDILYSKGLNSIRQKGKIDQTAAAIILQEYLDSH